MLKGMITLTNAHKGLSNPRVAALNVAWFVRHSTAGYTIVTLHSRSLDGEQAVNDTLHVKETEEEIDELLADAQDETPRSGLREAMGGAVQAFGAAR